MSNYPPGVTGNEPAIAGYPEGNYSAPTCNGYLPDDTRAVTLGLISDLADVQHMIGRGDPNAQVKLERIRLEMLDMPKAVDVECGFEGDVDASWDGDRRGNGTYFWTCPRCGSEQTDEREAGDDHPDL